MYGLLVLNTGYWDLVFQSDNTLAILNYMAKGQKFFHISPSEMKVIDTTTGEVILTDLPVIL